MSRQHGERAFQWALGIPCCASQEGDRLAGAASRGKATRRGSTSATTSSLEFFCSLARSADSLGTCDDGLSSTAPPLAPWPSHVLSTHASLSYHLALLTIRNPHECPMAKGSRAGLRWVRLLEDPGASMSSLAKQCGRPCHSIQTSLCEFEKFVSWSNGLHAARKRRKTQCDMSSKTRTKPIFFLFVPSVSGGSARAPSAHPCAEGLKPPLIKFVGQAPKFTGNKRSRKRLRAAWSECLALPVCLATVSWSASGGPPSPAGAAPSSFHGPVLTGAAGHR